VTSRRAGAATSEVDQADIIVVGAGFAGLTAARSLRQLGRSVQVLEANNRVGGRTKPAMLAGEQIDIGGQWVGPTQTRLLALATEHGVEAIQQHIDGEHMLDLAGVKTRYRGELPALPPEDLAEFGAIIASINGLADAVGTLDPWSAPEAIAHDAFTVETWLLSSIRRESIRSLVRLLVRSVLSCEASEVSFLFFLSYVASAGGLDPLIATRGGAQDSYFVGGVWQIASAMAAQLGPAVRLGAAVTRVAQDDAGATVTTQQGSWRARRVIIAVPPPLAARIAYDPPLPAQRDGLTQRMPLGSVIKLAIAYDRPFWRAKGLSGLIVSDRTESGPWFDRVSPLTRGGALVGFFEGAAARRWAARSPLERRDRAVADLASYLGDEARNPTDYAEEVWANAPFNRGGYVCVPGPGVISGFGPALLEPVGRIHWSGTETAARWQGYIDGAIRSGERAAAEVASLL